MRTLNQAEEEARQIAREFTSGPYLTSWWETLAQRLIDLLGIKCRRQADAERFAKDKLCEAYPQISRTYPSQAAASRNWNSKRWSDSELDELNEIAVNAVLGFLERLPG